VHKLLIESYTDKIRFLSVYAIQFTSTNKCAILCVCLVRELFSLFFHLSLNKNNENRDCNKKE
jgi:hypothetical protein